MRRKLTQHRLNTESQLHKAMRRKLASYRLYAQGASSTEAMRRNLTPQRLYAHRASSTEAMSKRTGSVDVIFTVNRHSQPAQSMHSEIHDGGSVRSGDGLGNVVMVDQEDYYRISAKQQRISDNPVAYIYIYIYIYRCGEINFRLFISMSAQAFPSSYRLICIVVVDYYFMLCINDMIWLIGILRSIYSSQL